jgi:hypothetical protein
MYRKDFGSTSDFWAEPTLQYGDGHDTYPVTFRNQDKWRKSFGLVSWLHLRGQCTVSPGLGENLHINTMLSTCNKHYKTHSHLLRGGVGKAQVRGFSNSACRGVTSIPARVRVRRELQSRHGYHDSILGVLSKLGANAVA